MSKKCLITGGCGFIFSNFVRKSIYKKSDYTFISLDRFSNPATMNNVFINATNKIYPGDITDNHILEFIFDVEKPDVVIHAASTKDLNSCIQTNILGTQVVLEKSIKHNVEKFIYINDSEILDESENPNPQDPYEISKYSAELLVKNLLKDKIHYNTVYLSKVFGHRQDKNEFIPSVISSLNKNEDFLVEQDHYREWTFVDDVANALHLILEKGQNKETYGISSNFEFYNTEIALKIASILKKQDKIVCCPSNKEYKRKITLDSSKLKSLGWELEKKFKDSLEFTVNWYNANSWILK